MGGIVAGITALVVLDGFWILAFPIAVAMALSERVLAGVGGFGIIVVIASACWFFGDSIARRSKRRMILSSLILLLPIGYNCFVITRAFLSH